MIKNIKLYCKGGCGGSGTKVSDFVPQSTQFGPVKIPGASQDGEDVVITPKLPNNG